MKRALVLEGGGIRSAYVAGVLMAFHDQGFNQFDAVVGTSAGACCGANFIAGEPEKNRQILEDYLTGNSFVRFGNIFSRKNIVDIDFLIDEVCAKLVPLQTEKVKNSPIPLYITAVDYLTGEICYFNSREHDLKEALRASCAMPYLYRKKVVYRGRRYLDGGLLIDIPVQKALDLGCDEIVVVSTRMRGYQKPKSRLPKWVHRLYYHDSPAIADVFGKRHLIYNETLRLISNPPAGKTIHLVAPKTPLPVKRTTRDKSKVKEGVLRGYDDGLRFLMETISPLKSGANLNNV